MIISDEDGGEPQRSHGPVLARRGVDRPAAVAFSRTKRRASHNGAGLLRQQAFDGTRTRTAKPPADVCAARSACKARASSGDWLGYSATNQGGREIPRSTTGASVEDPRTPTTGANSASR